MVEHEKVVLLHKQSPCLFGCKTACSCEYTACYTILKRTLHKLAKNVKTVQVAGHFDKLWSTKSSPISVLLTTGTVCKVAVPQNIKHYLLKELVNLYSKLDKNLVKEPQTRGKRARTAVAMSGIKTGDGTND